MDVIIAGKRMRTASLKPIGKGGEADIFEVSPGIVLKLFKAPDHPDYAGEPHEQKGARDRLIEHQRKLPAFPRNLPGKVIAPLELATVASGQGAGAICGYTMKFVTGAELLIKLSQRDSRLRGITSQSVVEAFKDLRVSVNGLHNAGIVIGDFNDLNGLVKGSEVHIIDTDSFQFGQFYCRVFTQKFVDPTLCDPKKDAPLLSKPYNQGSDWYSFAALLMQSLLFVGPYGGVYQPKSVKERISHDARPLHRVTVFHPEVRYPKPAVHWKVLPDDLLQAFHEVFEKDRRGEFPEPLLSGIEWRVCPTCSLEHARFACPVCAPGVMGIKKETVTVKGTVKATTVYPNRGIILSAAYQGGKLRYLAYEGDQYRREDGTIVMRGRLEPTMRFRISGSRTLIGKGDTCIVFEGAAEKERLTVDTNGSTSLFDANESTYCFSQAGQLKHGAELGPEYIGDVFPGQTQFWIGSTFGFGFYWAGRLRVGFVFDPSKRGLNDSVKLPPMRGQIIGSSCYFSKDRAWFFWSAQDGGRRINQCIVVRPNGAVEGHAQAEADSEGWLGTIHGKCAVGDKLLCATDEGIVQIKHEGGGIVESKRFPDTEPFISTDATLLVGSEGLYAVTGREITLLKIS
ncbi:MAG: hypothetical protein PHG25_00745 [Candidatus Pacebacteria bacterium]|nr:hypothetical protein [Candidatus Paceibacterota bacterium]